MLLTASLLGLVGAGCEGTIEGRASEAETPSAADAETECSASPGSRPLLAERRLTSEELLRTFQVLVGEERMAESADLVAQLPSDRLHESPDELDPLPSQAHTDASLRLAIDLAERIAASRESRAALATECADQPSSEPCVEALLDGFAPRAFRRPLSQAERDRLSATGPSDEVDETFTVLVARLLSSPALTFHHWSSPPTPYDVASRIAYTTTGGPPDDVLVGAASRDELSTPTQIRAQVTRLLESPWGRRRVADFFRYWLRLDAVPVPSRRASERLGLDAGELQRSALAEVDRFVEQMVFTRSAEFRELITSPLVYPEDDALAGLYGTAVWHDGDPPVEAPHHRGLLGRVALLLSQADRTSPIMRGIRLRERLLCQEIEPPDLEIIDSRVDELGAIDRTEHSTREATERLTGVTPCYSCHQLINPPGFVFESFDPLGAYRTAEVVYDETGREIARHAVDTTVADLRIGPEAKSASRFDDVVDLVADQAMAHVCVADSLVEFYFAHEVEACATADVVDAIAGSQSFVDIIVTAIATEEMLR